MPWTINPKIPPPDALEIYLSALRVWAGGNRPDHAFAQALIQKLGYAKPEGRVLREAEPFLAHIPGDFDADRVRMGSLHPALLPALALAVVLRGNHALMHWQGDGEAEPTVLREVGGITAQLLLALRKLPVAFSGPGGMRLQGLAIELGKRTTAAQKAARVSRGPTSTTLSRMQAAGGPQSDSAPSLNRVTAVGDGDGLSSLTPIKEFPSIDAVTAPSAPMSVAVPSTRKEKFQAAVTGSLESITEDQVRAKGTAAAPQRASVARVVLAVLLPVLAVAAWYLMPRPAAQLNGPEHYGKVASLPVIALIRQEATVTVRVANSWTSIPVAEREEQALKLWNTLVREVGDEGLELDLMDPSGRPLGRVVHGTVRWTR